MIPSYLLGVGCGIAWWQLKVKRKRATSLLALLLLSVFYVAWTSTFLRWPLSLPFWVGWPPGYGSYPEATLVGINLFETPLIIMGYSAQFGPPYLLVMPMILLYIFIIDAGAGFLGLAIVLIPYAYWIHQKRKRKALTF